MALLESMGRSIVEDDFQLICFDIVSEPSTPDAYIYPDKGGSSVRMKMQEAKTNIVEDLFDKILRD